MVRPVLIPILFLPLLAGCADDDEEYDGPLLGIWGDRDATGESAGARLVFNRDGLWSAFVDGDNHIVESGGYEVEGNRLARSHFADGNSVTETTTIHVDADHLFLEALLPDGAVDRFVGRWHSESERDDLVVQDSAMTLTLDADGAAMLETFLDGEQVSSSEGTWVEEADGWIDFVIPSDTGPESHNPIYGLPGVAVTMAPMFRAAL